MGRRDVIPAPGPSEWPRPVCTVTATFRGFAASENVSKGKESNSTVSESRGPLHSYPSFFFFFFKAYYTSHFFFFLRSFLLFIYLFMAVLGLRFCARAFSSCGKWGPLLIAVRGPLTITASLAAEHRLQTRRLSSCGSRA